jgi:ergothioneine biosynthesis protein EgtB
MTSTLQPSPQESRTASRPAAAWLQRYRSVRRATERLCDPLSPEDCALQSMEDASPAKWHLAHTTWFFETFVLAPFAPHYRPLHPEYAYLFNSYYQSVGAQYPRPERGLVSRPSFEEVRAYRHRVDDALAELLDRGREPPRELLDLVTTGIHHEQQHQELLLTDVKHLFSRNPLSPAYRETQEPAAEPSESLRWLQFAAGDTQIGYAGDDFAFDCERPRHRRTLVDYELASRPATHGEYLEFVKAGGYEQPEWWLSDGFALVEREGWRAPLYWTERENAWHALTLSGLRPLRLDAPVCHLSFYEADAYARFRGARLPTEVEWEHAAAGRPVQGNFVESGGLHPAPVRSDSQGGPAGLFGDVWEWTGSAYGPYPGYRPPPGALGEYNGKFMANQMVLRGGSCASPSSHLRASYRNFFYPHQRWQFSGVRLARDAS